MISKVYRKAGFQISFQSMENDSMTELKKRKGS
jgi:hypothetical protein